MQPKYLFFRFLALCAALPDKERREVCPNKTGSDFFVRETLYSLSGLSPEQIHLLTAISEQQRGERLALEGEYLLLDWTTPFPLLAKPYVFATTFPPIAEILGVYQKYQSALQGALQKVGEFIVWRLQQERAYREHLSVGDAIEAYLFALPGYDIPPHASLQYEHMPNLFRRHPCSRLKKHENWLYYASPEVCVRWAEVFDRNSDENWDDWDRRIYWKYLSDNDAAVRFHELLNQHFPDIEQRIEDLVSEINQITVAKQEEFIEAMRRWSKEHGSSTLKVAARATPRTWGAVELFASEYVPHEYPGAQWVVQPDDERDLTEPLGALRDEVAQTYQDYQERHPESEILILFDTEANAFVLLVHDPILPYFALRLVPTEENSG